MRAVLVFPRATVALLRANVAEGDRLIAVDGGAETCHAAGLVPELVVGDMDSVTPATLAALEKQGARIERHPADKRDTDAALALQHARRSSEVLFVGAGGGRPDHAMANLHLLAQAATWARVRAVDDDHDTWIVTPDRPLELRAEAGTVVSAIPFDPEVTGVTYDQLSFGLTDATFRAGDPYGMSNVALAPPQRIRIASGRLIVIVPHE